MMKPKVLLVIDQDKPKWCFYQIAWQIKNHLQYKYEFTIATQQDVIKNLNRIIAEHDAVLLFYWGTFQIFKNVKQKSKISIGIYDYLSWNYYKDLFDQVKDIHSFFVGNHELADLISEKKNDAKIYVCEDGVDTDMFKPKKFIVGWTGKSDWGKWYQDASFKGVELIRQAVDGLDDVSLLIQDASIKQISHENMKSEFFDKIDCYICASKQEGTPNTVLEALSCGIPVISTNVGIVPKLENVQIIERTVESIKQAILTVRTKENSRRQQIVDNWDWSIKVLNFDALLCDMLGLPVNLNITPKFKKEDIIAKPRITKENLSTEVTIFVITVDRKGTNFKECIKHLEDQNSIFDIIIIEGIAPMDRAFNEMIKRCKTPFFIQVDDDMMLNQDAVFYLHDKIKNAKINTAIIASPLRDTHLQRTIMGVKIYDHDIIKKYPFTNSYSCEISQFQKFTQDGFRIVTDWQPSNEFENSKFIGRHGENYTPFTAYERYYRLFRKQNLTGQMIWVEEWLQTFLSRYKQKKDKIDLFSFYGAVVGFLSEKQETGEKDFTKYNEVEGYNELLNDPNTEVKLYESVPSLLEYISLVVFKKDIILSKFIDLWSHFGEPEELSLFMTSKCNLDCWYCKRNKTKLTYDMNVSTVKLAINRYPTIKSVCIAGLGEPLMCENFESIINYLNGKSLSIGLITNGLLLIEKRDILRKYKFNYISISLKDETLSDPKVIEGIELLVNESQNVGISYVVHKGNYRTIPTIIRYGSEHGVKFIHFQNVLPYTPDFDNLVITDQDQEILNNIESYKRNDTENIVKLYPVPISKNNPCKCKSVFKSISMNAEGFISPCRRVMEPSNLFSFIGLNNPYEHPSIIKLRRSILSGENLPEECKNCWGNWYE